VNGEIFTESDLEQRQIAPRCAKGRPSIEERSTTSSCALDSAPQIMVGVDEIHRPAGKEPAPGDAQSGGSDNIRRKTIETDEQFRARRTRT
jgi:hypothetical protein